MTSPNSVVCDSLLGAETPNAGFSVLAYGVRIEIRVPPQLLSELSAPIVPFAVFDEHGPADATLSVRVNHCSEGNALYEIAESGKLLGVEASLQAAAHGFESWAQLTVATLAKDLIFVHAGVVAWRNRAIVVPGRSLTGKTALTLALAEAGAEYYSDEYAIFDAEGRVHPFRRIPKIRAASGDKVPNPLRGGVLTGPPPDPIPLGLVLITRYEAGSNWQPRRLTYGETLLGLLDNTVPLRIRPEQSVKALSKAVANAQGFESPRGDAAIIAKRILAEL